MTRYIEQNAKSILRKSKYTDSWFISKYNMNLYRGCEHGCAYCDGRSETYRVEGDFSRDIIVKINAPLLLEKELQKIKEKAIIFLGGGVGDAYQPAEEKYGLTRKALELIERFDLPPHILTKSTLVKKDTDLLEEINKKTGVTVSFSISAVNQSITDIFEPGCATVSERFELLNDFKKRGFNTGIMLMPVIPFISDSREAIEKVLQKAAEVKVDFVLFSGMTLKTGRQKEHFFKIAAQHYSEIIEKYNDIYTDNQWGGVSQTYYTSIEKIFFELARKYRIAPKIPHRIYKNRVELNVEIAMALFHIYYFLKMVGKDRKAYETAGWKVLQLKDDLKNPEVQKRLDTIPGIGPVIKKLIIELAEKRRSEYYEKLLLGK